ncbi:copia protein [Tanacetum coccineum]
MKEGFLDSRGGGGKKKKSNSNDSLIDTILVSADGDELNEALGTNPVSSTPKVFNEVCMHDVGTGPTTLTPNPGQSSSYADVTAISECFTNIAYGFFLRKQEAYPIVSNYIRNTWGKYGLVRSTFSSSFGLFSFQFSTMDCLDAILENGPWFICNNLLILKKWHPDVNLLKEDVGTVPVWVKLHGVPVTTFSKDGLSAIATKLGTPLMLDSYTSDMCLQSWGRSSYARAMIELRADVELKDNIVVVMLKIIEDGFYTCNVRVEYEWKPPRCTCCKVFGHVQEECPKNLGADETKNLKKPSQTPKGISVGQKIGFKPIKQQVYQPVFKKPTANTSGNKKKDMEPTKEVSNSNSFDMLNSVENDVVLGTNGGTSNLVSQEANYSGSSFWNVDSSSPSTTPIIEKIDKMEKLIIDGKVTLDSYEHDDYEYDPYDDDMYDGQEIPEKLQAFYDNLDIKVRGRKKK